jgi:ferric-dicitrate binding protein FerR (iron transport regulator)
VNIEPLIVKFLSNDTFDISKEELEYLETWIENPENESVFSEYIKVNVAIEKHIKIYDAEKAEQKIRHQIKQKKRVPFKRKRKMVLTFIAAASILLMVTLTIFLNEGGGALNAEPIIINKVNKTIQIGTSKAILTLQDGSDITLEKGQNYETKNVNGNGAKLVYHSKSNSNNTSRPAVTYNYLTIPRGGQFYVQLSDNTKVWLNSETRIKYPVEFVEGETRQVELIYGEAYFDVDSSTHHNGSKFKVITKTQEVEVLGTEFNIKAYSDENSIYTTLIEGKVIVDFGSNKAKLNPNQQSIVNIDDKNLAVAFVDVYDEISWKDGIFSFKNRSLKDIMKVLSRWYDTEVIFSNKDLEEVKFVGVLNKNQNIEDILLTLKTTKSINAYEIKNNTIILK